MPCDCATTWSKWVRIGADGWVIVKVASRCAVVPVEGRTAVDGVVRSPCEGDPAVPAPPGPAPFNAGCRISYELSIASAGPLAIASFSTGTDSVTFQPAVGPNAGQTVDVNAPLGDLHTCVVARTGSLAIADTQTGATVLTLGEIRICKLRAE